MAFKQSLLTWANRLGITARVRDSAWRRDRLLILCYHGISLWDEHEWNPSLYVTQDFLRSRLAILRDHGYNVLPLGTALELLTAGKLPPRSVALTFDDGTVDFACLAVPLLSEFGFPATVYLTTHYSDVQLPVFDTALSYILWKGRNSGADLRSLIESVEPVTVTTEDERARSWERIQRYVTSHACSSLDKDGLLREISRHLGVDYSAIVARKLMHIMPRETVQSLPRDLVDVQLHTHRHRTPREEDAFVREINDNRQRLEALGGEKAHYSHFCYPSGDYDGRFLPWLRALGVTSASTCVPGIASRATDPLLLPRFVDTMSQSSSSFEGWLSGLGAMLPARRNNRFDPSRLSDGR